MLQNCRDNLFHSSAVRRNVMKRFGNLLTALAAIVFVISSTAAIAEAQRKNERQIRDQVRGLNAQIDDFQFGLDHQLRPLGCGTTRALKTLHWVLPLGLGRERHCGLDHSKHFPSRLGGNHENITEPVREVWSSSHAIRRCPRRPLCPPDGARAALCRITNRA